MIKRDETLMNEKHRWIVVEDREAKSSCFPWGFPWGYTRLWVVHKWKITGWW